MVAQTILSGLLPSSVSTAEAFGDLPADPPWPGEASAIERAIDKRRREFCAGRTLARLALERLGTPAAPILPGPHREPTWPAGIVGSITHCTGYCGAAVALAAAVASIGIDAEPDAPLPPGVLSMIALEDEHAWIRGRPGTGPDRGRLLFSAKESVFKAWFPLTRRWLDFSGARIEFDEEARTFEVRLLANGLTVDGRPVERLSGRFAVHDGHLITAVAVPRAGGGGSRLEALRQESGEPGAIDLAVARNGASTRAGAPR